MLNDDEVEYILIASGEACRHRKRPLGESDYAKNLRRKANKILDDWCFNGVPSESWNEVKTCCSLVQRFRLIERDELVETNKDSTQASVNMAVIKEFVFILKSYNFLF